MMPHPIYRVDSYQSSGDMSPSRSHYMDSPEAHTFAEQCIREGASRANIVAVDGAGPFVVKVYYAASVPSLHTRPSRD